MENLGSRTQCLVYLVTYSRADPQKIANKKVFASVVKDTFEQLTVAKVQHWVVSEELHQDDGEQGKFPTHLHMALKLTRRARWARVRSHLEQANAIKVNFSSAHNTYYSAYQYTTKEDRNFVVSPGHPQLTEPPNTERAIKANKRKGKGCRGQQGRKKKEPRYSSFDVVEIIRHHRIKSRLELIALATEQKMEGKLALAQFIANRGVKAVEEALALAGEFDEAPAKLARMRKSRVQLLQEAHSGECVANCRNQWLQNALSLIARNKIPVPEFCSAVYNALHLGRAKYRNIYIYTWCGEHGQNLHIGTLEGDFQVHPKPRYWVIRLDRS